jgi:hypothetical protein
MRNADVTISSPKIDYSKLIGLIHERRFTRRTISKKIGVSETAFGQWILKGEPIHGIVIWALASCLEIKPEKFPEYFFKEDSK